MAAVSVAEGRNVCERPGSRLLADELPTAGPSTGGRVVLGRLGGVELAGGCGRPDNGLGSGAAEYASRRGSELEGSEGGAGVGRRGGMGGAVGGRGGWRGVFGGGVGEPEAGGPEGIGPDGGGLDAGCRGDAAGPVENGPDGGGPDGGGPEGRGVSPVLGADGAAGRGTARCAGTDPPFAGGVLGRWSSVVTPTNYLLGRRRHRTTVRRFAE
ncbi:hypothetical protein [Gordonia zhenghanii]|uniref:hypothetical protein n=1 Tax=Gordonia zhenghanii TaxID=2911516 RepID=UPI001F2A89F3|nr:hypothetical protein [Gordonia zhenghanii]